MDKITTSGLRTLKCFAPTCTINSAMMAGIRLLEKEEIATLGPFKALFTHGKPVDEWTVLCHFGGINHFRQIEEEGTIVAYEIPSEFKAFLHTALPLDGETYSNQGVVVNLKNQILVGPKSGSQAWAHLAGKFYLPGTEKLAEEIKKMQRGIPGFIQIARKIERQGGFDYSLCPNLLKETKLAIKALQK